MKSSDTPNWSHAETCEIRSFIQHKVHSSKELLTTLRLRSSDGSYPLHHLIARHDEIADGSDLVIQLLSSIDWKDRLIILRQQNEPLSLTILHYLLYHGGGSREDTEMAREVSLAQKILDLLPSDSHRAELIRIKDWKGRTIVEYDLPAEFVRRLQQYLTPDSDYQYSHASDHQNSSGNLNRIHKRLHNDSSRCESAAEAGDEQRGQGQEQIQISEASAHNQPHFKAYMRLKRAVMAASKMADINIELIKEVLASVHPQLVIDELTTKTGLTLLHLAAKDGNIDVALYLLSLFDSFSKLYKLTLLSKPDHFGRTALHYAVQVDALDIIKALMTEAGSHAAAEIARQPDREGRTPLSIASDSTSSTKDFLALLLDSHWKMLLRRPAKCLIFFNEFKNDERWKRDCATDECEALVGALQCLGIEPGVYESWEHDGLKELVTKTTKDSELTGLFVFIMSHGSVGCVYDHNKRRVAINDILSWMSTDIQDPDDDIPKVLIMQRCRIQANDGTLDDGPKPLTTAQSAGPVDHADPEPDRECECMWPSHYAHDAQRTRFGANTDKTFPFVQGYSISLPEYCVIDSTLCGLPSSRGLFMTCIKYVVEEMSSLQNPNAFDFDLSGLFIKFNSLLKEMSSSNQVAVIRHTLSKKVLMCPPSLLRSQHGRYSGLIQGC